MTKIHFLRSNTHFSFAFVAALAGCGGGGGGDIGGASPVIGPAGSAAVATLILPSTGKTPWNVATVAQFGLKNAAGAAVSGALTCSSDTPSTLVVAADCSSINGKRLGNQLITVSGGGVSAQASIKVIPQPQPLGTQGSASSNGSGQYNLVVTTDGRVLGWGANVAGVLGQGKSITQLASLALPTAVKDATGGADLKNIVSVSAGNQSAMALTEDGEIFSWGDNNNGVLGRTALNGDPLPGKVVDAAGTSTLKRVVSVSVGDENAVALLDDGSVLSWGYYSGQAGADPKRFPNSVPAVSGGGSLGNAVAVSAGWNWSAALLADGRVVSWGYNAFVDGGQGLAAVTTGSRAPAFVVASGTSQPISGVVSLSAGYNFGLALNAQGQVLTWGDNSSGQLGQSVLSSGRTLGAVLVKAPGGTAALGNVAMVAAGGIHALALDTTGNVWSWGYSQNGQLGDGPNHPRVNSSALPAAVVGTNGLLQLNGVSSIAAGYGHSVAVKNDGNLLIWGDGFRSNLGQGGTGNAISYVPLSVKNEAGTAVLALSPIGYWPNLLRRAN